MLDIPKALWPKAALSAMFMMLWTAYLFGVFPKWAASDGQLLNYCIVAVVHYWLGSSHGSDRKTELMNEGK